MHMILMHINEQDKSESLKKTSDFRRKFPNLIKSCVKARNKWERRDLRLALGWQWQQEEGIWDRLALEVVFCA